MLPRQASTPLYSPQHSSHPTPLENELWRISLDNIRARTDTWEISNMAAAGEAQKKSRLDWRKEKELEEARKAGTAPALTDEEGKWVFHRWFDPHVLYSHPTCPWVHEQILARGLILSKHWAFSRCYVITLCHLQHDMSLAVQATARRIWPSWFRTKKPAGVKQDSHYILCQYSLAFHRDENHLNQIQLWHDSNCSKWCDSWGSLWQCAIHRLDNFIFWNLHLYCIPAHYM